MSKAETEICSVEGCGRPYLARGYCTRHWKRWRNGQDPTTKSFREKTVEERFWERVDKSGPDDCWMWTGNTRGTKPLMYGILSIDHRGISAHRLAYEFQNGTLPQLVEADYRGTCVRHTCDNTLCMNGRHLIPGTHVQNMQDKVDRHRTGRYKTHCKRGHPRTPENIYQSRQGPWHCKPCHKDSKRRRSAQKEQRTF